MKKTKKLTAEEIENLKFFSRQRGRTGEEVRRVNAVLLLDDPHGTLLINSLTGFNRKSVFRLRKKFREHGTEALVTKKRKPRSLLRKGELEEIGRILNTTTPKDHGYDEAYWSTLILGEVIEKKYGVKYKSRTPLQLIFKKFKISFHKPGAKYIKQNQKEIEIWKKEIGKKLEQFDFTKDAVLLMEDEMILTTQTTFQKIWLPVGKFPKIDVSSTRKRRCFYGFLNVFDGKEISLKAKACNTKYTIKAMNKIAKAYPDKTIVIIWDNAIWHKSKEMKKFLTKTKHKFHLINFPPYAPELNPQEHVWKAGMANITHNKYIKDIDKKANEFVRYLNKTKFDYKFLNLN